MNLYVWKIMKMLSFIVSFLSSTLSTIPPLALERKAPRMPVDRTADGADVHLLMWLHLAPAQFAVSYEGLVFINLFWRYFWKIDDFSIVHDIVNLFPTARASRMMSPPFDQTWHTKAMSTFKWSKLLFCVWETNGTLFSCTFCHFDDPLHPPCDSRVNGRFSPLGRFISGLILADFSRALFGTTACLPLRWNSLSLVWWAWMVHFFRCWAEWENLLWLAHFS